MKLYLIILIISLLTFKASAQVGTPEKEINDSAKSYVDLYFQNNCIKDLSFSWNKQNDMVNDDAFGFAVWEFKGLTWSIVKTKLAEADSLNGVQWKGEVDIKVRLYREYKVCGSSPYENPKTDCGQWREWQQSTLSPITITIIKQNNKWNGFISSPNYQISVYGKTAPDCEFINKLMGTKK